MRVIGRPSGGRRVRTPEVPVAGSGGASGVSVHVGGAAAFGAPEGLLQTAARVVLAAEDVSLADLSLTLVDNPTIVGLNEAYLGRDGATDVIAFPLWEPGEVVVGDIYVGFERAALQASEAGIPLDEELVRLVVHGTLHVLGWDHPEGHGEREASPMWSRQEELVLAVLALEGLS